MPQSSKQQRDKACLCTNGFIRPKTNSVDVGAGQNKFFEHSHIFFPAEDTAKNERNNFPFKQKKTELIPSSEMTMVKDCSVYAAATA